MRFSAAYREQANARTDTAQAYARTVVQASDDHDLNCAFSSTSATICTRHDHQHPGTTPAAGIPADVTFATKPQLARRMIERAAAAKVPFAWVAGDEVYGDNGPLWTWLEARHIAYVLAVACDHRVPAGAGRTLRADHLAARLPKRAWQRLSAGQGAKGQRWYDWARVTIAHTGSGCRYLLIRRNRSTGELAFYRCCSPQPVTLAALVTVAGLRWTVEENFQAGKGLTGLDQHQVRRWTSWYRWATLAMLAAAFLAIAAATEHARQPASPAQADPADPQRDRPPARHPDQPRTRHPAPDALVPLATPPPAPRPGMPLPAAIHAAMKITIYGWSIRTWLNETSAAEPRVPNGRDTRSALAAVARWKSQVAGPLALRPQFDMLIAGLLWVCGRHSVLLLQYFLV